MRCEIGLIPRLQLTKQFRMVAVNPIIVDGQVPQTPVSQLTGIVPLPTDIHTQYFSTFILKWNSLDHLSELKLKFYQQPQRIESCLVFCTISLKYTKLFKYFAA